MAVLVPAEVVERARARRSTGQEPRPGIPINRTIRTSDVPELLRRIPFDRSNNAINSLQTYNEVMKKRHINATAASQETEAPENSIVGFDGANLVAFDGSYIVTF